MTERNFRVWRGDIDGGEFREYAVEAGEGMVVLDAILRIQTDQANDLAVRWNCKAGKCGSCSVEIDGKPKLACMTRLSDYDPKDTVTIQPMKTFPIIRDLVTDVSWNYEQNKRIAPFRPRPTWRCWLGMDLSVIPHHRLPYRHGRDVPACRIQMDWGTAMTREGLR